ncbi:hypothetical protein D3C87_803640 [compost metagenome]
MSAVLHDMASCKALAEFGRDDEPTKERQVDLASMGMSGDREGDPLRNVWENIRVVTQQEDGLILRDASES